MKFRVMLSGLLVLAVFLFFPVKLFALDTQDFSFDSFSADYYLSRDDKKTPILKVDEVLVARFPDFDQNHGILRAIPETYQGHTLSLKINSVSDENERSYNYNNYTSSHQNDNLVLKIGDGDKYVQGVHTYKISYQMRNAINYQADPDELYWDTKGDQWAQVFGHVAATIHIPASIIPNLQDRQVCYVGTFGSSSSNDCKISREASGGEVLIKAEAKNVQPYQTLSVALAFDKGVFTPGPEIARAKLVKKI